MRRPEFKLTLMLLMRHRLEMPERKPLYCDLLARRVAFESPHPIIAKSHQTTLNRDNRQMDETPLDQLDLNDPRASPGVYHWESARRFT